METSSKVLTASGSVLQRILGLLLRRHQFSDSRFEDLMLALIGLCNGLIVFIAREPRNCRFAILEFANQQDIAYRKSWKLVGLHVGLALILLSHGN
jgi:hypothetical protein